MVQQAACALPGSDAAKRRADFLFEEMQKARERQVRLGRAGLRGHRGARRVLDARQCPRNPRIEHAGCQGLAPKQSIKVLRLQIQIATLGHQIGDILLMQNYVALSARNAAYKVARGYESLKMADNRPLMEQQIRENITKTLTDEKLGDKITVSQVQVRAITPADVIVQSANELVRAQNELKTKEVEVQTAKKEAERIAALNANAGAIGYMNAMANLKIAEGVANGKVQTIVVPYDFKGIVNAK